MAHYSPALFFFFFLFGNYVKCAIPIKTSFYFYLKGHLLYKDIEISE